MARLIPVPESVEPGPIPDLRRVGESLGHAGQRAWDEAIQRGYLVLSQDLAGAEERSTLVELWSWHCTAEQHPELYVDLGMRVDSPCWIRLDLSPTRRVFLLTAVDAIGRAARDHATAAGRWLFTYDTLELDQVTAAPDGLAAALLAVALDDRFTVPEGHELTPFTLLRA